MKAEGGRNIRKCLGKEYYDLNGLIFRWITLGNKDKVLATIKYKKDNSLKLTDKK